MITEFLMAMLLARDTEPRHRIGVVTVDCVALAGPELPPGTELTVADVDVRTGTSNSHVFRATVAQRPSECSAASHMHGALYYAVAWSGTKPEVGFLGIAFLGKVSTRRVGSHVTFDLGGEAAAAEVRSCTSQEGIHLTVWSGEPLTSKRLWHEYWYLGYDAEPSCEKLDYEEAAQQRGEADKPPGT
jgi:hypothetical protein